MHYRKTSWKSVISSVQTINREFRGESTAIVWLYITYNSIIVRNLLITVGVVCVFVLFAQKIPMIVATADPLGLFTVFTQIVYIMYGYRSKWFCIICFVRMIYSSSYFINVSVYALQCMCVCVCAFFDKSHWY